MIDVITFSEMLAECAGTVNQEINKSLISYDSGFWVFSSLYSKQGPTIGQKIDSTLISSTESHAIKNLKDRQGIILLGLLPDSQTQIISVDNYVDTDSMLIFLLEKIPADNIDSNLNLYHQAKMQYIMNLVKLYYINYAIHCCNASFINIDNTIRTEWEYQSFGGYNGLSIGFNLKNNNK